jgi:hypothetical protein
VAIVNGHQPYFSADYMVEKASATSNPYSLSDRVHQAISTQAFCNKVHSAMYDVDKLERSDAQTTRSSLLKMLEYDLIELESRLGSPRTRKSIIFCCLIRS